jgi:hypothetical protein
MMNQALVAALMTLALVGAKVRAAEDLPALPPALERWQEWVLHGVADVGCPSPYDDAKTRLPLWPATLSLAVDGQGGSFELVVRAFAPAWLPLPGDADTWPEQVELDEEKVPVVARDGLPSVRLAAGSHRVRGRFSWQGPPERIAIPSSIGILALVRDGQEVQLPDRDSKGVLWLRRARTLEAEQDQISAQVYRVLEDGLPLWLRTEVELTISGRSREEDLGCILPTGWLLSYVEGPIPVAVDAEGRLKAQVRAGTWRIRVDAFRTTDTRELASGEGRTPTVANELVALRARPEFRSTEFEGAVPVDVNLTTFPEAWRSLPVFRWETSAPLRWIVKDTGGGLRQPDQFEFSRHLWLDDDGRGITSEDRITGRCREISRLDAAAGHQLEVVRVDGERQLITRNPANGAAGIEVRAARPKVEAIGRTERTATLSATGWQSDADRLNVTFALPPGWRMLALFGADRVDGDWLTAWTLLDVFLLLVFTVGVFRMRGLVAAAVAFLAFGLAYHEAGSPRLTWLFLLAPVALLQATRSPRARWWLGAWRLLAAGFLLLHLVPFIAAELQESLYPQLEPGGIHYRPRGLESFLGFDRIQSRRQSGADMSFLPESSVTDARVSDALDKGLAHQGQLVVNGLQLTRDNMLFAPGTRTQTGIAKPAWNGNQVVCRWDGPVSGEQTLRPVLLPAWLHRMLAVVRVGLLVLLLRELLRPAAGSPRPPEPPAVPVAALLVGLGLWAGAPAAMAQDFPPPELLEELRGRLLEPAPAFPDAAEIPQATLEIDADRLRLQAEVHVAAAAAVPVPGRLPTWSPLTVTVDGQPATACRREDGYLWVWLPTGVHQLAVEGLLPQASEWVWTSQLMPRRITVNAPEWNVRGLRRDGRPEGPLFFTRRETAAAGTAAYDQRNYRGVVEVDRVLELGLLWKVHTTVRRLSEPGLAITLQVPLLTGERVLMGRGDGPQGSIEVTLPAGGTEFAWEGEIPIAPVIRLESQAGPEWVERWSVVPSPVWNLGSEGLAAIYEAERDALVPVWHPWPGESVTLALERPEAVAGRTLTIQSAVRRLELGSRRRKSFLTLEIESALGGDFSVGLPAEATVNAARIDGRVLPIRREQGQVLVGLQPGRQKLELEWSTDRPLLARAAFEPVGLPIEAANLTSEMTVPQSRWILWAHGPLRGPAVRFWAVLAVAVVLGVGLGRLAGSPLATHEWVLLLIGLTQVSVFAGAAVVGWLFLLARRGRQDPQAGHWLAFDLGQLVLIGFTVASLVTLFVVVSRGLLGHPEMFITGNGSAGNRLVWFAPAAGRELDRPWVFTVSIWFYRLLMLLWGLWLANAITRWLVMGWRQFTSGGAWRWRDRRVAG